MPGGRTRAVSSTRSGPASNPTGLPSADEVIHSRARTLRAIRSAVEQATVFVFTLGLTEAWVNARSGVVYPTCPGTLAGTFDPDVHVFRNLDYPQVRDSLEQAIALIRRINPSIKIILTVSPVPLTATAEPDAHVMVATSYSKSVLRAVAGDVSRAMDFVDYFPSYEIITAPPYRAMFFDPNMRSVNARGVDHVMGHFLASYGLGDAAPDPVPAPASSPEPAEAETDQELVCEEAVLEFYNGR